MSHRNNRRLFLRALGASILMSIATSASRADSPAPLSPKRPAEIIAHRGESHDAPENTMASYNLAWQRGDEAVECDIYLTKDGKLIISHDADTLRTTGGKEGGGTKLIIQDETAEALRKLDVGKWKGSQFAGEKMPLLDELLASVPDDPHKRLFIEVKIGPEATEPLADALKRAAKPPQQTAVISFKLPSCRSVKQRMPELKVYYLHSYKVNKKTGEVPSIDRIIADAKAAKLDGLDLAQEWPVDAAFARKVHEAGLELYMWTIDDPQVAQKLIDAGVDGITTNRSHWLHEQLNLSPEKSGQ
jgi:glycerophosphoryl diester phosphodiesterase